MPGCSCMAVTAWLTPFHFGSQEVVRELRKQMSEARSLKDPSKPEYEEKLNRLKQLRDLRSGYQDKIAVIKNNIKGLEFRTEVH